MSLNSTLKSKKKEIPVLGLNTSFIGPKKSIGYTCDHPECEMPGKYPWGSHEGVRQFYCKNHYNLHTSQVDSSDDDDDDDGGGGGGRGRGGRGGGGGGEKKKCKKCRLEAIEGSDLCRFHKMTKGRLGAGPSTYG